MRVHALQHSYNIPHDDLNVDVTAVSVAIKHEPAVTDAADIHDSLINPLPMSLRSVPPHLDAKSTPARRRHSA